MYVNSLEGLRVRNKPSIKGDRIGLLDNLTEVTIVKEDDGFVVIDGIESKWVYINSPIEGWVFMGFLGNETVFLDNDTKRSRFASEGFGFKYDLSELDSRTTFIKNHGNPINTAGKSVINRHNGLEDMHITLEYNNFNVEFYEWNENVVGSFPESMMLRITSKDSIEYLYGIKHGMTKEELFAIIGIKELEETGSISFISKTYNPVYISIKNNKIELITWYYTEE